MRELLTSGPATRTARLLGVLVAAVVLAAGCGVVSDALEDSERPLDLADWSAVEEAAQGQTVRFWLFGGDERVNRYIDEDVAAAAEAAGVAVTRIPVDDTADAVQRVLAERSSGRGGGTVDLIWINGENFALGKRAGVWLEDWVWELPNARYLDPDDPTLTTDFGVATEAQEAPWARAAFVFAHDPERTPEPPRSFEELLAFARENPGRFTYPAPPDFTGSAFVRQAVMTLGEDRAFDLLAELQPLQWREGAAFPGNEAELNDLFGNGEVDIAMSYNPDFVTAEVRTGRFRETVRPHVFDHGTLQNVSFVTIPENAPNLAGALVLADLLLSPEQQARKAEVVGLPTVLDLGRVPPEIRDRLEGAAGPHGLADLGEPLAELHVDRVGEIDERWRERILR